MKSNKLNEINAFLECSFKKQHAAVEEQCVCVASHCCCCCSAQAEGSLACYVHGCSIGGNGEGRKEGTRRRAGWSPDIRERPLTVTQAHRVERQTA